MVFLINMGKTCLNFHDINKSQSNCLVKDLIMYYLYLVYMFVVIP